MELLALDANFTPVSYITYTNLQWTRKYYECGEFSVRMLANDYTPGMKYVYTNTRPETGIIQKVNYTTELKGEFIQLSGFFLEHILNDKIIYPTFYASGNIDAAVRRMVNTYKDDIPLLYAAATGTLGTSVTWQETGGNMDTVCYSILQTQSLAPRCRYDLAANRIDFEVWKGRDLTQDQTINNPVTFSRGFRNLQSATVTTDDSGYKNFAVVGGQGEGAQRITVEVDLSNGSYKRKIFIDAKNEAQGEDKTLEEYREALRQKGVEKLLNYPQILNIEVETQNVGFKYLDDFDLGDMVDVVIDNLQIALHARIIAVYEVIKSNTHTVTLELGDKILSSYEKARL